MIDDDKAEYDSIDSDDSRIKIRQTVITTAITLNVYTQDHIPMGN